MKLAVRLALALALSACSGGLVPTPKTGPHLAEDPVIVPYPPPPAHVQVMPPPPSKTAVWIDGEWSWKSRRWAWQGGRWEEPHAGYFAPPTTVMLSDGTIAYFPGSWRDASGRAEAKP